ncbi:MAG: hypothetical protein J5J06_01565 [Phycisphaerae bacterium]|nr:hypothetical protein [Phycisphaerae bacterium]
MQLAGKSDQVTRRILRQRLLFMVAAGALVTCIRAALNETPLGAHVWAVTSAQLVCLVAVTIVGSWPLTSYRIAGQMGLAGVIGFTGTGIAISWFRDWPSYPIGFIVIGLLTTWLALCTVVVGLVCLATLLRRWYWPVYPEGHCQKCGYNLFGLEERRCPECGRPFEADVSGNRREEGSGLSGQ